MNKIFISLILVGFIAGCGGGPEKQSKWGTYQEPINPSELPKPATDKNIQVSWKNDIGVGAELGFAMIKPAFYDGALFVAERNGKVVKIQPDTGKVLWSSKLDEPIFSGVGVGEGIVSVGLENGHLVALDTSDGFVLWKTPIKRQFSSIPAVGKSRVVIRATGGLVFGVDSNSGQIVWTLQRTVPGLSLHGDSTPVIYGDAVLSGYASGKLIANNVVNGRVYWESVLSLPKGTNEMDRLIDSDTPPVIDGSTAYSASYQGGVVSLQLQNGALNWTTDVSTRLPMALSRSTLFMTDYLGTLFALDTLNGDIVWEQDAFQGHGVSMPVIVNGYVVIGDANGNVHVVDAKTGEYLESKSTVSGAVTTLLSNNDQIIVFSSTGDIAAIRL